MTKKNQLVLSKLPLYLEKKQALAALIVLDRKITSASTYAEVRKIINEATAIKHLWKHVEEVVQKAEIVALVGWQRVGVECLKVPKATKWDKKSIAQPRAFDKGRSALELPRMTRQRVQRFPAEPELRAMAAALHEAGKQATFNAIETLVKEREIKNERKAFEQRRDRGARVEDLIVMAERGEKFGVIYADPAWQFNVYSGKGKKRSADRHYDTSTLDAIKALPVAALAAADCALFLSGIWPELPGALDVIKAWGFDYKTAAFVWVKTVSETNSDLFTGMGYWTRANSEFCLLGIKGSPTRINKDVHQVVMAPVGEHSEKPEEIRTRIERLVNGPYLELFARSPAPGWTVWGNEIEIETIPEAVE